MKPSPHRPLAAFVSKPCVWALFALAATTLLLRAADPAWWSTRGAVTAAPPDDDAAANLGQLKHFATKAAAEMNSRLPGGAGSSINTLVQSWSQPPAPGTTRDDFAALTSGQLKAIARLFHARLIAVQHATAYPDWLQGPLPSDAELANLGQVKTAFAFDLTAAPGQLPEWWQRYYGNGQIGFDGGADPDGDGLTNLQEYEQGSDPNDFWNAQVPVLTIISGSGQGDLPGQTLAHPFVVRLSNSDGTISISETVTFSITSSSGGSLTPSGPVPVDSAGLAQISLTLPSGVAAIGTAVTVRAQASNGIGPAEVTFLATVGDPDQPPAAPDIGTLTRSTDGTEITVTWSDNADNETAYFVDRTEDNVTWTRVATLPPNATIFTDATCQPGRCYIYTVVVQNSAP